MDPKELRGLYEAYSEVYAPQEVDEAITSEKGKAKAAEMIAARSTPSGRAKSGQGASVAQIKHISRANVDNLGGTPPNPKIAKNPVKSRSYGGTGNKAARRAAALKKEEFESVSEMNAGPSTPVKFDSHMGQLVPNQGATRVGNVRLKQPMGLKKGGTVKSEEYVDDIYDIVLEYLMNDGHASTVEEAHYVMTQMDAESIQSIIEMDFKIDPAAHKNQQKIQKATNIQKATSGPESSAAAGAVKRLGGSGVSLPPV